MVTNHRLRGEISGLSDRVPPDASSKQKREVFTELAPGTPSLQPGIVTILCGGGAPWTQRGSCRSQSPPSCCR
jgi:hypothetical protein